MTRRRRLYLDTADLVEMADGRVAHEIRANLQDALRETGTELLISKVHLEDALSHVNAATIERFVGMVESFGSLVTLAREAPSDIEPHVTRGADIQCGQSDLRTLLVSQAAEEWFGAERQATDALHLGETAARAIRLDANIGGEVLTRRAEHVYVDAYVRILRHRCEHSPEVVLACVEDEVGPLVERERRVVLTRLIAAGTAAYAMFPRSGDFDVDVDRQLKAFVEIWKHPASSPGRFLSQRCIALAQTNRHRHGRRSDWLDLQHISYFPYVDVATCDGFMADLVARARGPELVTAVHRTRRLAAVIEALRDR